MQGPVSRPRIRGNGPETGSSAHTQRYVFPQIKWSVSNLMTGGRDHIQEFLNMHILLCL